MQRLEQERIVAEQRKETDAASAAAAAAAIADGVASADVTFQKEPNDGLEEVEAGPSIGQAASALSKDDKQPDEPKKKWWQQRNSRLASLLLLLLIVGGIVVGVVLGLGKSDNDDDGDASLALDDGMAVVMSLGNDTDSTDTPTLAPTAKAGDDPTASPSLSSTDSPSKQPTSDSSSPGPMESSFTINRPKPNPTTDSPSKQPATPSPVTNRPTRPPTSKPVKDNPTNRPTPNPTTRNPTRWPTARPVTSRPTNRPTQYPITRNPTRWPTARPVTSRPTNRPTQYPITRNPTRWPTARPVTSRPTNRPTQKPITDRPTNNAPLAPTPVIVDRSCEYRKSQTVFVSASPNFVNQQMFGGESDFDGDTAIVVNYDSGMSYLGAGAVWILERKNGIWAQADAFQSLDQEQFGWGIVVKGDSIVVGAPGYDGMMNIDANLNMYWFGRGRAMVGRRDDSGSWYQEAILSPNDLEWNAGFGNVLDIADCECLIAVGAWNDRDRRGSVYVYSKSNSGSWDQVQKLAPGFTRQSQDALFGNYGYTVVFSGDGNVLAVKSPYDYANGLRGAVYVYRQGIFGTYEEIEILSTPEGRQAETHNSDVTFIDNHLLVGAPGLGKVYVFRETNSGKYQKTAELTASDVGSSSQFGISLDGEGSNVMVGAQEGESSYLFSYDGNVWIERAKFNGVIAALSGSSIVAHNPPDFAMDSWLSSYGGEVNFYNLVCER